MSRKRMKELDAAGWPAFGLGFGRWTRVTRAGLVVVRGQVLSTPGLMQHAGKRVFVTLAGEVYSSNLDKIAGATPGKRVRPVNVAAQ